MFLTNLKLDQFVQLSKEIPEIRHTVEKVDGQELSIFCYMIQNKDTFKSPLARECRGITFDNETGNCVIRPFHKFFNVNETEDSLLKKINFQSNELNIAEKIDGSLAIPFVTKTGKIVWRSKKSFYSDAAERMNKFWEEYRNTIPASQKVEDMIRKNFKMHKTAIFEYIGPYNQIVIEYNDEELCYLCSRNNITGKYIIDKTPNNNLTKILQNLNAKDILKAIEEVEETEGYVIWDGKDFYKAKTKWYLDRHHLLTELSYKNIISHMLEDKLDDIKGAILQFKGDKAKNTINDIEKLEKEMYNMYISFKEKIYTYYEKYNHIENQKEFALTIQQNVEKKYLPFIFSLRSNSFNDNDFLHSIKKACAKELYQKYKGQYLTKISVL